MKMATQKMSWDELAKANTQLKVENKKLKEALVEITHTIIMACDKKQQGDYGCNLMIEIAEQALKG